MIIDERSRSTSAADRARLGSQLRARTAPESHAQLDTEHRADPVRLLAAQAPSRVPELVPLRHARMLASPFSFYRGAAAVMAADLAHTPASGLTAQLCGDAHLSNFGMFASPERRLLFDVNDFDETHPGPWEWDVKRLAASLVVAGRQNGYSAKQCRKIALDAVRRYQAAMSGFAGLGNLAVWYASVEVAEVQKLAKAQIDKTMSKRLARNVKKAKSRDNLRSLAKLTEVKDGRRRFVADPPVLVPLADLARGADEDPVAEVKRLIHQYAGTLQPGHRELARAYDFVDMARKVVGVGSVGTRCWVVLMLGRDETDPLFLQVKQAEDSVLARYVGHHPGHADVPLDQGARVVAGQRIMQAASDIFLGSQDAVGLDGQHRYFYVRQLQDWKGSAAIEVMVPAGMRLYGQLCAWTLARAHARSGDRIAIAAYLGDDDAFPQAVADFAQAYADLNEQDHARFAAAVAKDESLQAVPVG
ncbi:MAG: DUF2252 domain-containing protein [Nocardioidaceae bacterium]